MGFKILQVGYVITSPPNFAHFSLVPYMTNLHYKFDVSSFNNSHHNDNINHHITVYAWKKQKSEREIGLAAI